ncbi:hypothetical protein L1049_002705 [Liquidambar formosana]|uniref:VWFA domain-containing protein n=1 Tax=Liquidambar formosana TaxID=63359 RepID=A0AAP0NKH8_LIQFO
MGGKSSREGSWRQSSSVRSGSSSSWSQYGYPQSSYGQETQSYPEQSSYGQETQSSTPQPPVTVPYPAPAQPYYTTPSQGYSYQAANNNRKLDRRYSRIADNYNSLEEVTEALARAGLESSNLILGIDFTKSNEWTGARSFNRRSLHHIGDGPNPYEQAITIIGKTLAAFDEDNLIPCYGFGDASTHDQDVFSFHPEERICNGFEEVLSRYRQIVPHLRLAGPTSFAPIVEMAMTIVEESGGQYHVLVIIADGQVTRSVDTENGRLSPQEQKTVEAIVEASKFPLSIILVGVGDGPWDMMREFDDNIPARAFDNFQLESLPIQPVSSIIRLLIMKTASLLSQLHLLHLLQALLLITRFAPFASVIRRTWPLVVGTRHVATVDKALMYAQSVEAQLKPE